MRCMNRILLCTILLIGMTSGRAYAQSGPEASGPALDCAGSNAAWASQGIPCRCVNGKVVCDQPSGGHNHGVTSGDVKAMVVGTIFESLLTSLFTDDTATSQKEAQAAQQKAAALAAQQAAMDREKAREAQAAYEKMMRSYKQLDDSQGVAFKTLSDSALTFKTLDGDAETLAANARKPFDTPGTAPASGMAGAGQATPFFGDSMPIEDIRLLVNPENDPRVVDLRKAVAYVAKNLKDGPNPSAPGQAKGGPIIQAPDCVQLTQRLNGFLDQRAKFQKTINLAQEQVDVWETANRNALLNAAKDGIEYFTGRLLDCLAKHEAAAKRLQMIYERNAARMAQDGLDVAAIKAKIDRLRVLSAAGKVAELTGNIKDWQSFLKNGMSGLLAQLTSSNGEIQEMLDDPKMQKYFERESPELKALLDITTIAADAKVFGKWVAKKVPVIAAAELSVNEAYNGLDFFLSFKRMTEADQINGKVLAAAMALEYHIDMTSLALHDCRP